MSRTIVLQCEECGAEDSWRIFWFEEDFGYGLIEDAFLKCNACGETMPVIEFGKR